VRISDEHLKYWQRHGYVAIPAFLTREELDGARKNMLRYVPSAEEIARCPEKYPQVTEDPDHVQIEFPFAGNALNDLSTHPEIISFARRALGTQDVLLSQSAIWAKYAGFGSYEQDMHLDYEGNTLVVPADGPYQQVNFILYYTDVTDDMGPTCVVSREKTKRLGMWPPFRPRSRWPKLYAQEQRILVSSGGLFIFSMGTFHRASEMTAEFGARFSHHLVYKSAGQPWAGYHQWSRFGESPLLKRFIERATPEQRHAIGFPPPGDPYWTPKTLKWVSQRYPAMDMRPYKK
jgi:ectoine hydroxylase-related dioxygenase (phytanoyl-CoA dioxygenase family)